MSVCKILASWCFLLFCAWTCMADVPVGLCIRSDSPAVVDGRLDEPEWGRCEALGPFVKLDGSGPAGQQTTVRVFHDGVRLFIGCELLEESMAALEATPTPKDEAALFRQDCVEIFIQPDPDAEEYFHLAASVAGSTYDAIATGGPVDWTPNWEAATFRGSDRWFLEAAIPLSEIRLEQIEPGQAIGFNVCRQEKPHDELSCWSCTRGTFHNAALFGELVFGSFEPRLAAELAALAGKRAVAAARSGDRGGLARALQRLEGIRQRASARPFGSRDWQALRPELVSVAAALDRLALGGREALIWQVTPWHLPAHSVLPAPGTDDVDSVTVRLLQEEYETVALAVANPGDRSLAYHVTATDLLRWHENEEVSVVGRITVREAVSMRTRGGGMLRDALPRLTEAQRLVVPAGENAVVWLTFHAAGLSPGSYVAGLDFLPLVGAERRRVRLRLEVLPLAMTRRGAPFVHNWAYLERARERGWEELAARDLEAHYVNVNMIRHNDIPWPVVDTEGNLTASLDFTAFDARIDLLPEGTTYLLNLALHWFADLRTDLTPWTPEHKHALRQWALAIRDHFEARGLGYDRWAWYPKDEPATDEYAQLVRNFAETVHAADPRMLVFANPFNRTTPEQIRVMGEEIDIWCPNLSGLRPDDLAYMKTHGKRVWSYRVLSRLSNPYGGYRLPFWRIYRDGLTGFGYWAYDSVDGSVWDDADGRVSDYAVYYEGPAGPISSVRWEATREGAEDYRLLALLREAVAEARAGGNHALAQTAAETLENAVATTLAAAGTRDTADRQRRVVLDALLGLRRAAGAIDAAALTAFERSVPLCLTGNGGPRVRNIDTGGWYTYSVFPTHDWNEQCGATEGRVWFRGEDAEEGPQLENRIGGDLTDGSWFYRRQYVNLWQWSPHEVEITFDLRRSFRLVRVDVFGGSQTNERNRVQALSVSVSESGQEGTFQGVGAIEDCPGAALGAEGEFQMSVSAHGRFVRLSVRKKSPSMTVGEVRIWGHELE